MILDLQELSGFQNDTDQCIDIGNAHLAVTVHVGTLHYVVGSSVAQEDVDQGIDIGDVHLFVTVHVTRDTIQVGQVDVGHILHLILVGLGGHLEEGGLPHVGHVFGLVAVCTIGASPTEIILFAQAANAFLLPITAILLMIVCNDKKYMDGHNNGIVINILGVIVLALTLLIAFKNMTGFTESFMKLING